MLTTSGSMKEGKDGHVEMKDLAGSAMEQCVDFMYTGEIEMTQDSVESILHASTLIQLDQVTKICKNFLLSNILVANCLKFRAIAVKYNSSNLAKACKTFVKANYEAVTKTRDHQLLCKDDVMRLMSGAECWNQTLWEATSRWINFRLETRQRHLMEFMELFEIVPIPVLLTAMAEDPLVEKNKTCEEFLARALYSGIRRKTKLLKRYLNARNCFAVKRWTSTYCDNLHENELGEIVDHYMARNLHEIFKEDQFNDLSHDVVSALIASPVCENSAKWNGVIKWIHADDNSRRPFFPELLKMIDLGSFNADFIQGTVRSDPLVQAFPECKELVTDSLYAQVKRLESSGGRRQTDWFSGKKYRDIYG